MSIMLESCRKKIKKELDGMKVLRMSDSDEVYFLNKKEYGEYDVVTLTNNANTRRDLFCALAKMRSICNEFCIVELDLAKDNEILYSKKSTAELIFKKDINCPRLFPNITYIFKAGYAVGFNRVDFLSYDNSQRKAIIKFWRNFNGAKKASYTQDITNNTVVGSSRLSRLEQFSGMVRSVSGDVAEVGVYKGGSSYLLCQSNPGKTVYSIDTFDGMPDTDKKIDHHTRGNFGDTSLKDVDNLLAVFNNSQTIRGIFPEVGGDLLRDKTFSLVHLDVDIYKSVMDCLGFFYPRMSDGGILVLDDFFCPSTLGATKAVNDFFMDKQEAPIITAAMQVAVMKGRRFICF